MRALVLLLPLLCGCIGDQVAERAFLPTSSLRLVPEDLGLEAEPMVVPVDGALLHAWRFDGGSGDALVVLGGNADNKELFLPLARELVAARYDVVLVDWRGYGLSTGEPALDRLIPDAAAVVERVRRDPRTRRLALYGVSLGSPVALGVAAELGEAVDAVAVESLLVPRHALAQEVGGFLAFLVGWTVIPAGFEVASHARELEQPLLFVHGAGDWLTPLVPAAEVFAGAQEAAAPRAAWIALEAGHAPGIAGAYGPEVVAQLRRFLDAHLRGAPDPGRVTARWIEREERVRVELGPDAQGPTPVEVVLVREGEPALALRAFVEPGGPRALDFAGAGAAVGAFANVPACEVRALEDGGWERANPYLEAQRAAWTLESWVRQRLMSGPQLYIRGEPVGLLPGRSAYAPGALAAACADVHARLAEEPDERALPLAVRLTRSGLWGLLAHRAMELGDEELAREALERASALLPPDPFAAVRFGDSSWQLGVAADAFAELFERLAAITADVARREEARAQAERWRALQSERARFLADWNARARAERDRLGAEALGVAGSAP